MPRRWPILALVLLGLMATLILSAGANESDAQAQQSTAVRMNCVPGAVVPDCASFNNDLPPPLTQLVPNCRSTPLAAPLPGSLGSATQAPVLLRHFDGLGHAQSTALPE